MTLRDILFTPGITRPAAVLAAVLGFVLVMLIARAASAVWAKLTNRRQALGTVSRTLIHNKGPVLR
jgi:hypothetical protein